MLVSLPISELSTQIIDRMATVPKFKPSSTKFREYASQFFSKLLKCNRLDVLSGNDSLKKSERIRHMNGRKHGVVTINRLGTKVLIRWPDYLAITENKSNLITILQTDETQGRMENDKRIVSGGSGEILI